MARSVECNGISIRQVLFFEGAASSKDALSDERDDSFFDAGGYVLCGGWWVDAAVDIS